MKALDIAFDRDALGRPDDPQAVDVRWLGTAGFELRHGEHVVLIDPYVTRASFSRCLYAPLETDVALVNRIVPRADAIVVGHTHFDHVLDVPTIARLTGGTVFGSSSASTLCRADGVPPSQIRDVERELRMGEAIAEVGPFRLRFVPSAHAKLMLGTRVPFEGDIRDCDHVPLAAHRYKCGAVFGLEIEVAGKRIYHIGSADLIDANLARRDVDLLLMCVLGWQNSKDYASRVLRKLAPRAVLLSHWDNFFRPIDQDVRAMPTAQLPRLVDSVHDVTRDLRVGTLPLLGELSL